MPNEETRETINVAKKSMLQRELKREKLVRRYAAKRAELKRIIRDLNTGDEDRAAAVDAGWVGP